MNRTTAAFLFTLTLASAAAAQDKPAAKPTDSGIMDTSLQVTGAVMSSDANRLVVKTDNGQEMVFIITDTQVHLALGIHRQHQRLLVLCRHDWISGGLGQLDIDALGQQRCGDHEDDQQHQHHVDVGNDVDLTHQAAFACLAHGAYCAACARLPCACRCRTLKNSSMKLS